ncbi:Helix-turn-helix domain-containing protein [Paenibacillus tianmuensis]|uniref:Helix-turn-helix domain-containing protein n=1 Tax=Paenibacillus tianmuensis TaxID=624147 RepID=A0A1G4SYM8_9BACL|nr:helix-turn-helix domain-containing protein [Paenibacillus tianmuensis]SCW73665.1 Helix-turn-helix domain-containing protein [Paenibacillus tianmuensis]
MRNQKKTDEIAAERFKLLSPLLASGLDAAKSAQLKSAICAHSGLSKRTLRRYPAQYRKDGFDGLKPKPKGRKPLPDTIPAEVLEEAILLRREVPKRSVWQIIQILEWDGKVTPGKLKRSTLQDRLTRRGYSSRQMRMYAGGGTATVCGKATSNSAPTRPSGLGTKRSKSTWYYSWMTQRAMFCTGPSMPRYVIQGELS